MPAEAGTIEIVRDQLEEKRAAEIASFLSSRESGLNLESARRAASEAIAIEVDGGEIVGVASVRPASLELIGGRPFWSYQSVLTEDSDERWNALFTATFDALSGEFEHSGSDQLGVFVLVEDPAVISRRSEAVWPDAELMLAGYLDDGRQVRVRYFLGAVIGPGVPGSPDIEEALRRKDTLREAYSLEDRYRIEALAESSEVGPEDVLRLWSLQGVVPEDEAKRRVQEVELVATERGAGVVGVSSLYLKNHQQLRMNMWHYRTYVAPAHRKSNVAAQLGFTNIDRAQQRYLRGEDTRAPGWLFELEHEGIKRYGNLAWWPSWDLWFIGENERGDHIRVHWFPGARVQVPPPPTTG